MSFADKLKAKAESLGLADKAQQAKEKAAQLADANRDKIAGAVDKAGSTIDAKTGGKHADKIAKAQDAALKGVDKVAASNTGVTSSTSTAENGAATSSLNDDLGSPIDRAIGADAGAAGTVGGANPAERAIGADAPSIDMGRVGEGKVND